MRLLSRSRFIAFLIMPFILLGGCSVSPPDGITPVKKFDKERYLGTWYEIARLDHSFERGMDQVSATYSKREDGGIKVLNRGYKVEKKEWSDAEGKAYFVRSDKEAYLKVSFFGPFYGAYVVFDLGENYKFSFVTGNDRSYLWFLSRTPNVSEEMKLKFTEKAKSLGFETEKLIWVKQDMN